MRKLLLALLLATSGHAIARERIAIVGGHVVSNDGAQIDNGVVLMANGTIERVGPAGTAVPAGYRVIDASGKWVTPGIVAGLSQFGLAEVSGVSQTNDLVARQSPGTAALLMESAFNPNETSIPVSRVDGVTAAVVGPYAGRTLFGGVGYIMSLGEGMNEPLRPRAFQYVVLGERGSELAGGSRPAAWNELTNALEEAARWKRGGPATRSQVRDLRLSPEDAETLTLVLNSAQPLLVKVDRASDIRQALKLPRMYAGLRLVLVSANEGWMVADEIARAGVPVITLGMSNRPDSFESLGATMSNVGRLVAAGVKVALGVPELDASFQPRDLANYAGNLVAQAKVPGGSGLKWDQAFAAITRVPAEIFGLSDLGVLKPGARADVVVWSGDPLELSTLADLVIIGGVEQSLTSRQTELAKRYLPGRDRTQLPEAYRR